MTALLDALRRLDEHGTANDWIGPDPYEGLNATRFVGELQRRPMGRRVLIQAVKRSPVNLRPILGIRPTPNSTANGWALAAYALGGFLEPEIERRRLEDRVERLLALRAPQFTESAWGYLFPTQSRVFFYDRNSPAVVTTVWCANALLDAADRLGRDDLVEQAAGAARFLMKYVPQTEDAPGAFFGYLADDRSPIHNSNLWACALLARVAAVTGERSFAQAAVRGVEWSLERQRPDGSWPYGERDNLSWVDGFHTGYNLDALDVCRRHALQIDVAGAWERGVAYYREHLFLADGTPKYYANHVYPIDATCVAQGIQTLSIASRRDPSCLPAARKVFDWALAHMRRRDGLFYFQRRRYWVNRVPHMRWAQATMFLAMAHLLAAERRAAA